MLEQLLPVCCSCNNVSNSTPSLEVSNLSAYRKICSHLWKSKLHVRVHTILQLIPTLNYFNPARSLAYCLFKIYILTAPHVQTQITEEMSSLYVF
jgi:hypothetical protein